MSVSSLEARVDELLGCGSVTTCTISDALDGMGIVDRVLHHDLRRVTGGTRMFYGVAYPVRWAFTRKTAKITAAGPSTWSEVRGFLASDLDGGAGRVYVAGCGDLVCDAALAGGMSVTYFKKVLGFERVVLGGAVRDLDQVTASDMAVVATGFVPGEADA
jgi:regulator of RNase E activity RraA